MIAFEAATPFQVYNCINILNEYHLHESADLYVYFYASDMEVIVRRVIETGLFSNVYSIKKIPESNRIAVLKGICNYGLFVNGFGDTIYDTLYISYTGFPNLMLYNALLKRNPHMKVNFYEDGVTSYYNGIVKYSSTFKFVAKLRGLKIESEHIERILLYKPSLNKVVYNNMRIEKINPCENEIILEKIDHIFGITQAAIQRLLNCKYIFFDHDYKKYVGNEFYFNFDQNTIVNDISKVVGKIVVKISPLRDEKESDYSGDDLIVSNFDRAPWEVLACHETRMNEKCLITVCSNAVITPKTVYDAEPYVLIIGKALFNEGLTNSTDVWTPKMDNYYEDIKNIYHDKSKFMVPDSLEEVRKILMRLEKNKYERE